MSRQWALCMAFVFAAAPAMGQSTGTPVYQAPYRAFSENEIGVSFSDPGSGFALEGSYRRGFNARFDGSIRAGFADAGFGGSDLFLVGVDGRFRVLDHSDQFPLDGSFTVGFGLNSGGGYTLGMLPIGFSMGRRILIEGSSASLVPYFQPTLTPLFGDGSGTDFSLGFGVDLRLTPRLDLRFSGGLGDRDGIGLTAAFVH